MSISSAMHPSQYASFVVLARAATLLCEPNMAISLDMRREDVRLVLRPNVNRSDLYTAYLLVGDTCPDSNTWRTIAYAVGDDSSHAAALEECIAHAKVRHGQAAALAGRHELFKQRAVTLCDPRSRR